MFMATDWEDYKYRHKADLNTTRKTYIPGWPPIFYHSMKGYFGKCWSIEIPYIPGQVIHTFGMMFRADIFPEGIRPQSNDFGVILHYPRQLWRADFGTYEWKSHEHITPNQYTMRFKIENIIVLKRRNKGAKPCNENWNHDDDTTNNAIINSLGCYPPYHKRKINSPSYCATKEQMRQLYETSFRLLSSNPHPPPCQQIEKIIYTFDEFNWLRHNWINNGTNKEDRMFEILFEFSDGTYTEIEQAKRYNAENLVGNAGGYLGLLLGYRYKHALPKNIDILKHLKLVVDASV